ncbi:MAG: hypothetical protein POG24_08860, partial [Acidocella sp.]|nr:hypothetical protein [Acidocella sp.]
EEPVEKRPSRPPTPAPAPTNRDESGPPPRPGAPPRRPRQFSRVFGGASEEAPQPVQQRAAPAHREPVISPVSPRPEAEFESPMPVFGRAPVRSAQVDEVDLEIPAFLRRSNS